MAARVDPARVGAAHQSLHHFVAKAAWDDAALLAAVRAYALPALLERGPVRAWMVDDTGLPKKGRLSVGVARQYCGQLGKRDNCQVAVTLSVATEHGQPADRLPALPARGLGRGPGPPRDGGGAGGGRVPDQARDRARPDRAGAGRRRPAGGGGDRRRVRQRHRLPRRGDRPGPAPTWPASRARPSLWPPGAGPLPAAPWGGRGRPPKRLRREPGHQPLAAEKLAAGLPAGAWRTVTWREGTAGELASRFAAVRVRPAHGDFRLSEPRAEEWLLAEWPEGEEEPTKYWLSTLPEAATLEELVATAKLRWRIERDFEELKQELGLGHFEGRGWRGFHHHASLCIAAYGFLVAERCRFSPPGWRPELEAPERPAGYRPRGSSRAPGAAQPGLDRDLAPAPRGRADAPPAALPLLPAGFPATARSHRL